MNNVGNSPPGTIEVHLVKKAPAVVNFDISFCKGCGRIMPTAPKEIIPVLDSGNGKSGYMLISPEVAFDIGKIVRQKREE